MSYIYYTHNDLGQCYNFDQDVRTHLEEKYMLLSVHCRQYMYQWSSFSYNRRTLDWHTERVDYSDLDSFSKMLPQKITNKYYVF